MKALDERSLPALVAQVCIVIVIAVSVTGIFVQGAALSLMAGAALLVYFLICWRLFTLVTWVPVILSLVMLALSLWRGISLETLTQGMDRMAFLAALLAVTGMLRVVAQSAPEIAAAGRYLTSQPPSRRYWALSFGGHVFGLLINLGGLAILLDMTRQALAGSGGIPDRMREWKLRRMTTATLRGFSLVALWSPFGFGINLLLLAMPGLSYFQIGPLGFALTFAFGFWGWLVDRLTAPRPTPGAPVTVRPDPDDRGAVARMLGHVAGLAVIVFALNLATGLDFQRALLVGLPVYSLIWAARLGRRRPGGPAGSIRQALGETLRRFPLAAGELGVFASAGLLAVLMLELVPVDQVQALIADWQLAPWQMIVLLNLTLFGFGAAGINPIITASVLGSLVTRLDMPGLSQLAAGIGMAGAWSCVMGFTPFITTVAYAGALIGRPVARVGLFWNGPYCLSALVLWTAALAAAVAVGLI
ncbi:hypothetical protein H5395_15265 [Paracoccus sp. MC1854]|uniref:hypothetical protein n=1 Tax=Paracoccus sp. MC1854 TaxID=2760306 RepID=UPI0016038EAC|nr:hypothetical protein [Paracoccus sp. MC1854]MBB1492854.1 hypothetical protein [Paracoccus sp. MC1854]